jgi:hypothetical protein
MRLNSNANAAMGVFAFMESLGRVLFFRPEGGALTRREHGPYYWSIMFIDENGLLCRSNIRVIAVLPDMRRIKVWSDTLGRECVLKVSRIVEASDLQSGRRVNMTRWLAAQQSRVA